MAIMVAPLCRDLKVTACRDGILSKRRGLRRSERHSRAGRGGALGDEVGQGRQSVGAGEAVVEIVGHVDAEFGGRLRDGVEDVPRRDARP